MSTLFNLQKNTTGIFQGVSIRDSNNHISVPPRGVIDGNILSSIPSFFKPVYNFIEELDTKTFYLQRTFSLGDVLMLVPVVKFLERHGFDVYMKTVSQYEEVLARLEVHVVNVRYNQNHPGLLFDWVVEQDHSNLELQKIHRVKLYFSAVGIDDISSTEISWDCKLENFPQLPFDTLEPFVVLQGKGANKRKWLPDETIVEIVKKFLDSGVTLYYIGDPTKLDVQHERLKVLGFSLTSSQLFTLIAKSFLLVCMDSGPLWISHFTKTPVAVIFGPTNPEQRITFHPFYPDATVSVQLYKLANCQSCFESLESCNGMLKCLSLPAGKVADYVFERITEVL